MSDPAKVLVRGPNWAGDLVMSTPGFRALRSAFPRAHITLQLREGLEPLMHGAAWFDEIRPVRSHRRGATALLREARALRRERYDLGLCIPDSFSSALLMRLGGVRRIVGYRRGGRGPLLHHAVAPDPSWGRRRMVARERFVLGLTAAIGCADQGTQLELFTTASEEAQADALVGARSAQALVAIAPGASYGPSKLWPAESFAQAADRLAAEGARVVIVGSPAERPLALRVKENMQEPAIIAAGNMGLGALKAILRRSSLLLCNDAGARHVAVAFGVPSVVLFGPTSLEKTNSNLERVTALQTDVECRPCYARECPIDHRCMTRLEVERVVDASRAALTSRVALPA